MPCSFTRTGHALPEKRIRRYIWQKNHLSSNSNEPLNIKLENTIVVKFADVLVLICAILECAVCVFANMRPKARYLESQEVAGKITGGK
jgi:hypothetical protein